jgi:hypothetical protein
MLLKKNDGLKNHDSLIDLLGDELEMRGYRTVYRNTEYSVKSCGEIDLWAKRDGYVLMFEMKATNSVKNRKKAYEQLKRAKSNCFPNSRVFGFYVSNYKNPVVEWIKNL